MATISRLLSDGTYQTSAKFDEVTKTSNSISSSAIYSASLDEITLQGSSVAKRETSDGKLLVGNYFDEVTIAGGITPLAGMVFDLDAANYSALPTNGSFDATNTYALTVTNANSSMSWNSANGGIFRKSTGNTTDQLIGGPNYRVSSQPYTVFMAYKLSTTARGRLLNTNESSPDWLMGSWFNGTHYMNVYYPGNTVNLGSDIADTNWHFIWGTSNGSNLSQLYIATNSAPVGTYKTAAFVGGFNQLRLFSRYFNATTSSEVQTADIGFVKVYNRVLSLSDIQTLWTQYHARFGI
jgi:hypothetical protein